MKTKILLIIAFLASLANTATAQQTPASTDIPANGILFLMGATTFILLIVILRLVSLVRRSVIKNSPGISEGVKKLLILVVFMGSSLILRAQETGAEVSEQSSTGWFGVAGWIWAIFILTVIVELVAIHSLMGIITQMNFPETAEDKAQKERWLGMARRSIPKKSTAELDLNHDYDGISELDNSIPRWWLYTFYATIFFSLVYTYRFLVAKNIPTQLEQLEEANTQAAIAQRNREKNQGGAIDENTVKMSDASGIERGQTLFYANCRACHGDLGQGADVGPNLTDAYWLHGGSLSDIFHSIKAGWPDKGMQSWSAVLSPSEMQDVASYIMSIQGTDPPGSKGPQGELYAPAEEAADTNSSETSGTGRSTEEATASTEA